MVLHSFDASLFVHGCVLVTIYFDDVTHLHSGHLVDGIVEFGVHHDRDSQTVTVSRDFNELKAVAVVHEELLNEMLPFLFESEADLVQLT